MPDVGPYSVTPSQVAGLSGAAFVAVIGQLLAAELAASRSTAARLDITHQENIGDGGVDARTRHAAATSRVPAGDTAWQFKAGTLSAAACAAELAGATEALAVLRGGGSYRLALGASLTAKKLRERREALESQARELGISVSAGQLDVLGGDALAAWLEEYPALAVSPMVRGPGVVGLPFGDWARSGRHATEWVTSEGREDRLRTIRSFLENPGEPDLHFEGVSGLGKTRLVMEALRGHAAESLVVYVPAEDQFQTGYLSYLQTRGRRAVIVIDECDAARHEAYAGILPRDTALKLITISEPSNRSTRSPMLNLEPMEDEPLRVLLNRNQPALWAEATRVIVDVVDGNIDYALKAARALLARRSDSASSLVDPADIRQFIVDELPEGALFLASCVLALFSRIGFDGEVGNELTEIARLTGVPEVDLRGAAAAMSTRGLVTKQGRFRAVGPHPVAIYLARCAWQELGTVIAERVLPGLDGDLLERLFRRASEIGDRALPADALSLMLGDQGPLRSLDALEDAKNDRLTQHLAVLAPAAVSARVHALISEESENGLRARSTIRRPLLWTLSKLAWHADTFEDSADDLLRLAMSENEPFSNNATGIWIDLFGTRLPATSARPADRLRYLERIASSPDPRIRTIAIRATARALEVSETIIASAELQGGAILDPRGSPTTWDELITYRNGVLDVIRKLVDDTEEGVAAPAMKALVEAIHPAIDDGPLRMHLIELVGGLTNPQQREIRMKLRSVAGLFERVGDDKERAHAVDELVTGMPEADDAERLWAALHIDPWDRPENGSDSIRASLRGRSDLEVSETLLDALQEPLPTAFEVGAILASLEDANGAIATSIAPLMGGANSGVVFGYLNARVVAGNPSAFDDFAPHYDGNDVYQLAMSTRGPRTTSAVQRVDELVRRVPVVIGARQLFTWVGESDSKEVAGFLDSWMTRLESQQDYNAVVDLAALYINRHGVDGVLREPLRSVVAQRADFADVGQQGWDWGQLASKLLESDPAGLVELMTSLILSDAITAYSSSPDGALFRKAIEAAHPSVWRAVMDQLLDPNSWRLAFSARDWLAHAVPLADAEAWVGDSVERARILASVATPGEAEVTPVGRYLMDRFGNDDRVASALSASYLTGFWSGNESDRVRRQIGELKDWLRVPDQSDGVKRWAKRMSDHLENQLRSALRREAEERW